MNRDSLNETSQMQPTGFPRAPIELLAEQYLGQIRSGGNPRIDDYVRARPDLADEIRELFPTLAMLENMAPQQASAKLRGLFSEGATVPESLGEYRVLREIGRGGMGVVYEAEHETMRRRVALKVLPAQLAEREVNLKRFLREARAAGGLHHTNIVPVFEVGEHVGFHFYAMQFIQGQNLDVVIEEIKRLRTAFRSEGGAEADPFRIREATAISLSKTVAHGLLSGPCRNPVPSDQASGPLTPDGRFCVQDFEEISADSQLNDEPPGGDLNCDTVDVKGETSAENSATTESAIDASSQLSSVGVEREDYFHRVARIGLQVADALAYAHGQGILHRDIKPSNLILDTAGVVWITDFGLAKNAGDDFTHTGDVVGTLRYMAPERFQGQADERSDIYSLGLTLYELCTLRHAFQAEDRPQLVRQLNEAQPAAPRKLDPRIPLDLETVVLKAIARTPANRYRSASVLAEDLRLFLSDRPVRSRRSSSLERIYRWCRRNPVLALLSSAVAILLIIVMIGSLLFGWTARRQAARLHDETVRARIAEQNAELARQEATRRLYGSCIDRARSGRWSGRPGQHFASLEAISEASRILPTLHLPDEEGARQVKLLRDEAIAAMPLIDIKVTQEWKIDENMTAGVAFAPGFVSYAQSDRRGQIQLRRTSDNELLREFPGPGVQAWVIRFSPDGNWMSAKYHRGGPRATPPMVKVWNVDTGSELLNYEQDLTVAPVAFRSDSELVAIGFSNGMVRLHRLPDGDEVHRVRLERSATHLAFNPDGRQLVCGHQGVRGLVLLDVDSLEQVALPTPIGISGLAWRPDHQEIAIGGINGSIYLLSLEATHKSTKRLMGHTRRVVGLQFLWQGRVLASRSWDGTSRLWNVESGQESLRIDGHDVMSTSYPVGGRLGFVRGGVEFGIWNVAGGHPLCFLHHLDTADRRSSVRFHPQNPQLLASGTTRGIELWDVKHQQLIRVLGNRGVRSVAFLDQGRTLLSSGAEGIQAWKLTMPLPNGDGSKLQVIAAKPKTVRPGRHGHLDLDAAGKRCLVQESSNSVVVLDLSSNAEELQRLTGHLNMDRVAISPSGDLAVTTTWKGEGVVLWDLVKQQRLLDLVPDASGVAARFSPQGRWLATTTGSRLYIWRCGDWISPILVDRTQLDGWPGMVAFSPNDQLLAAPFSRFKLQLLRPSNGERLAKLAAPFSGKTLEDYHFSRDGRFLAVADSARIQVWDVYDLRSRLQELGLDWDDAE